MNKILIHILLWLLPISVFGQSSLLYNSSTKRLQGNRSGADTNFWRSNVVAGSNVVIEWTQYGQPIINAVGGTNTGGGVATNGATLSYVDLSMRTNLSTLTNLINSSSNKAVLVSGSIATNVASETVISATNALYVAMTNAVLSTSNSLYGMITNGAGGGATQGYVDTATNNLAAYARSLTNGLVSQEVTNGLASQAMVTGVSNALQTAIASKVDESVTNGLASRGMVAVASNVLQSAIAAKADPAITNGLAAQGMVNTASNALYTQITNLTGGGASTVYVDTVSNSLRAAMTASTNGIVRNPNNTNTWASSSVAPGPTRHYFFGTSESIGQPSFGLTKSWPNWFMEYYAPGDWSTNAAVVNYWGTNIEQRVIACLPLMKKSGTNDVAYVDVGAVEIYNGIYGFTNYGAANATISNIFYVLSTNGVTTVCLGTPRLDDLLIGSNRLMLRTNIEANLLSLRASGLIKYLVDGNLIGPKFHSVYYNESSEQTETNKLHVSNDGSRVWADCVAKVLQMGMLKPPPDSQFSSIDADVLNLTQPFSVSKVNWTPETVVTNMVAEKVPYRTNASGVVYYFLGFTNAP